jgi:Phage capsid family
MPYDSLTTRTDIGALIPEAVSDAFRTGLESSSAVLSLFRNIPVGAAQTRFPILSALPVAYWVTGDTGLKQTTEMAWANKYLNVEELAVIFPIPEAVVDDSGIPIWDEAQKYMQQAAGILLDATVFFGTSAPASFPTNVVAAAVAAGNVVARGTATQANGGFAADWDSLLGTLETDGYMPTGGVSNLTMRGFARAARNTQGERYGEFTIAAGGPNGGFADAYVEKDGVRVYHPMEGQWPSGASVAETIIFNRNQFVVGVRRDFTWKLLDQAVIQDNTGAIVFNLAQQDMVAMRLVMRVGWQVANTINRQQPTEANRYPAATMRTPA